MYLCSKLREWLIINGELMNFLADTSPISRDRVLVNAWIQAGVTPFGAETKAGTDFITRSMYRPTHLIEKDGNVSVLERDIAQTLEFMVKHCFHFYIN